MSEDATPTRQRIVDAALKLFTERGIDSTTTREIAALADVNEVTLFRHFGNKEGIVRAAVQQTIPAETLPRFDDIDLTGDLQADLAQLTETIVRIHNERQDFFRFCFANLVQHPEHRQFFLDMQVPLMAWLHDFFGPHVAGTGLDVQAVALEFLSPIVMRSIRRFYLQDAAIDDDTFIRHHATIIATALISLKKMA